MQSLSYVRLFATPQTAAYQASLSMTNSQNLLKLMSIDSMMLSNHLILCHPLLLLPSIFPSIRGFSNESVQCIRWPKYWSFSSNIVLPMNIQDQFPLVWTGWISLQYNGLSRVFSNGTVQRHQFSVLSFLYSPTLTSINDTGETIALTAAAAAKLLQSCPTLYDPIDNSPPSSPVPGILQARILEWIAISFSHA